MVSHVMQYSNTVTIFQVDNICKIAKLSLKIEKGDISKGV